MDVKRIEDLRISDCCSLLQIRQDDVLVGLIDFQATDKEQQEVLNQLKILLKKDKVAYENCAGLADYITYIDEWYDGLYVSLANESIKKLELDESFSDQKKPVLLQRPFIATFFIYLFLIGSVVCFITFLLISYQSIDYMIDPYNSVLDWYCYFEPLGCLLSLTAIVGNIFIIRKKCSGFWGMSIMGLILVLPQMLYSYNSFLYAAIPLGCSLLLYYMILHIKQNGNNAWDLMKKSPSLKKVAIFFWSTYLIFVLLIPPFLSMGFGFRSNHFDNGTTIFHSRIGDRMTISFFSNRLANKLSSGSDGIGEISELYIKKWYERSIMFSCESHSNEHYYFDYADYLISIDELENAYRVLKDAYDKYPNRHTAEKLNQLVSEYGSF